jgi:hypothetical protein
MEEFLDHIPLSEEDALGLYTAGEYPAVIEKMEIKVSKAGNKTFVATIKVSNPAKFSHRTITTWFGLPYLLKHAYDATGQSEKYQSNKLSTKDLEGKKLMAKVKVSKSTPEYPQPQNVIWDFVVTPNKSQSDMVSAATSTPDFDDQIPF